MAPRSKVEQLPEAVREELERRLIASAFSGYEQLAAWLAEQGFAISKSSLHRFGSTFEDKLGALKIATSQARAVIEASPDNEGAMGQALTRLVQEKIFTVLLDLEVDPETIELPKLSRAIADLSRAAISQQKHASLVRKEAREELIAEQKEKLNGLQQRGGITPEALKRIRQEIYGLPE